MKGLAHAGRFVSISNVLDNFEAMTLFSLKTELHLNDVEIKIVGKAICFPEK